MSRVKRKIQRAARLGVYVYKNSSGLWDIFVEKETILGPRELSWKRREAVNFAHKITLAEKIKLTITYG